MPTNFSLLHDAWDRLVLVDAAGVRHVGVTPIHCFPMSDPDRWISLCDSHSHELALVEDLAELPADVREVLQADIARREFTPVIQRIANATVDVEPSEWQVNTDRGDTTLLIKSEDDVRRLGANDALVVDTYGTRYLIHDITKLDAVSRRILERYL